MEETIEALQYYFYNLCYHHFKLYLLQLWPVWSCSYCTAQKRKFTCPTGKIKNKQQLTPGKSLSVSTVQLLPTRLFFHPTTSIYFPFGSLNYSITSNNSSKRLPSRSMKARLWSQSAQTVQHPSIHFKTKPRIHSEAPFYRIHGIRKP